MKRSTDVTILDKYIIDPVKRNLNRKLEAYLYYDVFDEADLTTNNNGVDIISHQLELKFEGCEPIFISWGTVAGWFQYSLCVSETSFCNGVKPFSKKGCEWTDIVGQRLKGFEVYGYKENVITLKDRATGRSSYEIFKNEPHLLVFYFDNGRLLGLANFYLEKDFIPKSAIGDDVWIIFTKTYLDSYIEILSLERLYSKSIDSGEHTV